MDFKDLWRLLRNLTFGKEKHDYIGSYVKILDFVGCWTGGDRRCQEINRLQPRYWLPRLTLSIMIFTSIVLSPVSIVQLWKFDLITVLEPCTNFFSTCLLASIIGSLLYKGESFAAMITAYKEMKAFNQDSERFTEIYKELDDFSKIVYRYFAFLTVNVTWSTFGVSVKALVIRSYFFGYWYPEISYVTPYFELVVIAWYLPIVYSFLTMAVVYGMSMTLLFEAIAQLKMLNMALMALADEDEDRRTTTSVRGRNGQESSDEESTLSLTPCDAQAPVGEAVTDMSPSQGRIEEAETMLKLCVQHHQAINKLRANEKNYKFVLTVREAFHLFLVSQYTQALFPTLFAIVLVSKAPNILDLKILMYLLMVVCLIFHQGVFCWLSSRLEEESEAIREAVYGCQWQNASENFKRSMRVIMSFSNQPQIIKLVGFIPLNMKTFYSGMEMIYTQYMSLVTTDALDVTE